MIWLSTAFHAVFALETLYSSSFFFLFWVDDAMKQLPKPEHLVAGLVVVRPDLNWTLHVYKLGRCLPVLGLNEYDKRSRSVIHTGYSITCLWGHTDLRSCTNFVSTAVDGLVEGYNTGNNFASESSRLGQCYQIVICWGMIFQDLIVSHIHFQVCEPIGLRMRRDSFQIYSPRLGASSSSKTDS